MGKALPSATRFQEFTRVVSTDKPGQTHQASLASPNCALTSTEIGELSGLGGSDVLHRFGVSRDAKKV
ncbi:hypothetical protein L3X38_031689 [Prunus dulcis]|uniref:Uncharacterized protein n=1 Tax=Prunus dulcis TaxID=3755 RepID=A0AAD4VE45_PRUDU|nr:hypothetical protein L3X38_031689 [Prunus dulcis]